MSWTIREFVSGKPLCRLATVALALTGAVISAGCVVRVQERPVYVRERPPQPQPQPVVVDQPAAEVVVEPVAAVVYEPAPAEVVAVYETDLTPRGHWVTNSYGRCWVWNGRHADWRPYTVGHWVLAPEGWLWVAEGEEAEWGATCYHYGRWYEDPAEGWLWVPGSVWAPSWCAWREGGGYSCWAPLPPECGDGHQISVAVVDRYVRPDRFVCVRTESITNINIHNTIIVNNVTIINKTTNITRISYVNNRVVNRGVDVKHVEKAVGHPIKIQQTVKVTTQEQARREIAAGHTVAYRPTAVETYVKAHPIEKRIAEHKTEVEHKTVEHKTEVEHRTVEAERKPEVEHKTVEVKKEPEHKTLEHKTVEVKTEPEHKTVEHKTVEVKTEPEHKTVEHKTEVEHKTVEVKTKPEVEHKTVEHKTEVERKPELERKTVVDPKKESKKDPKDPKDPKKEEPK